MEDLESLSKHAKVIGEKVYGGSLSVSAVVEGAYDHNWTREHELFYCRQVGSSRYVRRLLLEDGGEWTGYTHLRPLTDGLELSETYIAPPEALRGNTAAFLTCAHSVSDYGQDAVSCVPFITPDQIFSMCAQAAIWICLRILSEGSDGQDERLDLPTIQTMSRGHPFADSEGLPFKYIARVLRMCRCNAFYFSSDELTDDQLEFCLYAYVESGAPVIVGVDVADLPWWEPQSGYHAIVAIGHTMDDGSVDSYIFHDESTLPYQRLTSSQLRAAWHHPHDATVRAAVAAVPPQVSVRFEIAYQLYQELLTVCMQRRIIKGFLRGSSLRPRLMDRNKVLLEVFSAFPGLIGQLPKIVGWLDGEYYWSIEMLSPKRKRSRGCVLVDASGRSTYLLYSQLDKKLVLVSKTDAEVLDV